MKLGLSILAGLWIGAIAFTTAFTGAYHGPRSDVAPPPPPPACAVDNSAFSRTLDLEPPRSEGTTQPQLVTLDTACGLIEIELSFDSNPRTATSFAHLASAGAYDFTAMRSSHSGTAGAGDPSNGQGTGPGYWLREPVPAGTAYPKGTVAMELAPGGKAGSSGSMFFIVTGDDASLAPDFAVVGHVTDGFETLDRIVEFEGPIESISVHSAVVSEESGR